MVKALFLPICLAALFGAATVHADTGEQLITHFQCGRCHELPAGLDPGPKRWSCLRCHQGVLRGDYDNEEGPEAAARWKARLKSVTRTPSLAHLSGRLSSEWVAQFIRQPFHVRPRLAASMLRLPMSAEQAEVITAFLCRDQVETPSPSPTAGDPAKGLHVMHLRGCFGCHLFSGAAAPLHPPGTTAFGPNQEFAPDLRYTRNRMTPAMLAVWLDNPSHVSPGTLMPPPVVSKEDLPDVIAAISRQNLEPLPVFKEPHLEPLPRYVRFSEVKTKVIDIVCRHCHADTRVVGPEAGPGSTGGFGYAGVDMVLTSEEGVKRGLQRPGVAGRESVLSPRASGYPRIVEVMLARHREEHGVVDSEIIGMPLGLTPIPYEDIRLVLTWALQEAKNGR